MISKLFCIAGMIVLASFAVRPAAGATCSNASLSGTYGFLHDSTDSNGTPNSAAVSQLTFDATKGTFTGETTTSRDGVISTLPLSGTYAVASNCTGTGYPAAGSPFSFVVTSTGFLALHLFAEGFAVKQGASTCTNAGVESSFGFETTGVFLAAVSAPAVAFIGELKFTVDPSEEGVISGHVAASEDGKFHSFEEVIGSYTVDANCWGTATITPKGRSALNFSFVVVDGGNQMLVVETDADTVVSGTLQRSRPAVCNGLQSGRNDDSRTCTSLRPDSFESCAIHRPSGENCGNSSSTSVPSNSLGCRLLPSPVGETG